MPNLKHGDPIWYRQSTAGGYGFDRDVPGEFLAVTTRRVVVKLFPRGTMAARIVIVAVHPKNVRPRPLGVL